MEMRDNFFRNETGEEGNLIDKQKRATELKKKKGRIR